jgi:hypothetical protein
VQSDLGFGIIVWNAGYPDNGIPSVSSLGKLKKPDNPVFFPSAYHNYWHLLPENQIIFIR